MKGLLEFNLPEEQDEFDAASHASEYKSACEAFAYYLMRVLRGKTELIDGKGCELTDQQVETLEAVQKRFSELTEDVKLE